MHGDVGAGFLKVGYGDGQASGWKKGMRQARGAGDGKSKLSGLLSCSSRHLVSWRRCDGEHSWFMGWMEVT